MSRAKVRTNVIRAEYADYNDGAVTSHDRKTRAGALGRTDVVLAWLAEHDLSPRAGNQRETQPETL